jgi:hypothetical protein
MDSTVCDSYIPFSSWTSSLSWSCLVFLFLLDWGESVPCTATASYLVIPVLRIDEWLWGIGRLVLSVLLLWQLICVFYERVEHWWNDTDRKPNFEKNLLCCLFVHHRCFVDSPCTQMQYDCTLSSTRHHPKVHCCEISQASLAWCDKNSVMMMMRTENGWNSTDRWKPKYWEMDVFRWHFVHHKNAWWLTCDQA